MATNPKNRFPRGQEGVNTLYKPVGSGYIRFTEETGLSQTVNSERRVPARGDLTGHGGLLADSTVTSQESCTTSASHLSLETHKGVAHMHVAGSAVDDGRLRAAQRVHRSGLDVGPETVTGVGVAVSGHLCILGVPLHALCHGHLADIAPATAEKKSTGADQCTCGARAVHVRC